MYSILRYINATYRDECQTNQVFAVNVALRGRTHAHVAPEPKLFDAFYQDISINRDGYSVF